MKCLHVSDTHGHHSRIYYPPPEEKYDVLFHTGDLTLHGKRMECFDFIKMANTLVSCGLFKHVVFTPGNHDAAFESFEDLAVLRDACGPNVHLLINEEITIDGFKIWGSPYTPKFGNWSFMYRRGEPAKALWSNIPEDADIVLTHGPVRRKLDAVPELDYVKGVFVNRHTGCVELGERIKELNVAVHLCGHIHEGWGRLKDGDTLYLNSCIMDERYRPVNKPQSFEIVRGGDGKAKVKLIAGWVEPITTIA